MTDALADSNPLARALSLLPHGAEFRFIDRLIALNPGTEGVGEFTASGNEPYLRGHFPGAPILPGVLLVEAAAQLAGVVAQSDPTLPRLAGLKLTAIRHAKILGTAAPGETLIFRAHIAGRMNHLIQANATAEVKGKIVLEATLTLSGDTTSN